MLHSIQDYQVHSYVSDLETYKATNKKDKFTQKVNAFHMDWDKTLEKFEGKEKEKEHRNRHKRTKDKNRKIKSVTVTDETGKNCKLKLGKLDETDAGVGFCTSDSDFITASSISDGHYYYLHMGEKGKYTIYQDKRAEIGHFFKKGNDKRDIRRFIVF